MAKGLRLNPQTQGIKMIYLEFYLCDRLLLAISKEFLFDLTQQIELKRFLAEVNNCKESEIMMFEAVVKNTPMKCLENLLSSAGVSFPN